MDKQNVVHPYNGIQFTYKKKQSTDALTWVSLENIKWKKPNTKGDILYGFYLYEMFKMGKSIETESTLVARGWGEGQVGSDG